MCINSSVAYAGEKMDLSRLIKDAEQHRRPAALPRLKVAVIGSGGAGCNSIDAMMGMGLENAHLVAVNTDSPHLQSIKANEKLLIGKRVTKGRGAGGDPQVGEDSAVESENEIKAIVEGNDIVFLTGGLGGGTGTGSLPVIADIAKQRGAMVIAIVSTPFKYEGENRSMKAADGLQSLMAMADSTIVLDNNRLIQLAPNLPVDRAFLLMDMVISRVIKGITEAITTPTMMNIDFADFRNVMKLGGVSTVLYAESSDPERLVTEAVSNPFLDIDYSGARGALINIIGGPKLNISQISKISESITKQLDRRANITIGAGVDSNLGSEIHLLAVLTGIRSKEMMIKQSQSAAPVKMANIDAGRIAEMVR